MKEEIEQHADERNKRSLEEEERREEEKEERRGEWKGVREKNSGQTIRGQKGR